MTGYAVATSEGAAGTLTIEIKSVNSRFLDLQFRINDDLRTLEPDLRAAVMSAITRGKVEVRLSFGRKAATAGTQALNLPLLAELARLQSEVGQHFVSAPVMSVAELLRWPGVIEEAQVGQESLQADVGALTKRTIAAFVDSRKREGAALEAVLIARIEAMEAIVKRITPLIPQVVAAFQQKAIERMQDALGLASQGSNSALSRQDAMERIRQEVILYGIRIDVSEELARLSGDEFAVGLFDISQHFEASTVAQKLLASLVEPFLIEGHDLRVGASIGISVYPQDGHDAETLLRLADIAMYRAKQDGGGDAESVAFYSQDMNLGMQARMRLETGLRHALAEHQLLLHYQPKYALGSGRMIGAEALVRWRHPVHGMIPPADFIPLAESTGLVVQVGEWVLEAACAQAQAWKQAGLPPIRIAVNVSAREFTSALPARVAAMLERYGLEAAWLELEITESTLMHNIERVIGIMDRITALGVALSLDDFGTGYSSLSYLKRFPIDTLKIDRSFTTGIPSDASDCAIATTIISIAQQLHHKVIAEGVETAEQMAFLNSAGCDEVQGYLFSRPLAAEEFERVLRVNWDL